MHLCVEKYGLFVHGWKAAKLWTVWRRTTKHVHASILAKRKLVCAMQFCAPCHFAILQRQDACLFEEKTIFKKVFCTQNLQWGSVLAETQRVESWLRTGRHIGTQALQWWSIYLQAVSAATFDTHLCLYTANSLSQAPIAKHSSQRICTSTTNSSDGKTIRSIGLHMLKLKSHLTSFFQDKLMFIKWSWTRRWYFVVWHRGTWICCLEINVCT